MKRLERYFPPARSALDLDNGVERDQRDAEIGRMRRDAALAPAQYGMKPVVAAVGVAAGAGIAFVAGARGIVKIRAARSLQEVAADGRGIAKLRGGAGQKRLGDRRKAPREIAIMGEIGIANQRPDAHAAVGQLLDPVETGKMGDVDKPIRAASRRPSSGREDSCRRRDRRRRVRRRR